MKKNKFLEFVRDLLFSLALAIPVFLVYRSLFRPGPLAWGDAPYFYPEGLRELFSEPFAWTNRGVNFGGVNQFMWLAPLMFLYGASSKFLGWGNDLIIRLLFYFPALLFALSGPFLLTRHLKYSKLTGFFASLFFLLNTFFILVVDGGQVGIALAYGFFPIACLFLIKLVDQPSHRNFWLALITFFLLAVFDPRVAAICFLTVISLRPTKNLVWALLAALGTLGLSLYWLIPFTKVGTIQPSLVIPSLNLSSLLNSLLIFAPHWPGNEFGKVLPPPFYFAFLPVLLFGSLLFKKERRIFHLTLVFLIFAFLAKGTTPPLGGIYNFLLKFPLGSAVRESSKFFIPLALLGGVLIGETVGAVVQKFKSKFFSYSLVLVVYLYLLFLIQPAIFGRLNFVLSHRQQSNDYRIISEKLKNEKDFFRTAWFPERSSLGLTLEDKPGLDAKALVENRPLAAMNTGGDVFNFMHDPRYLDYFDLLGIKYLVFTDDPRKVKLSDEEIKNKQDLLELVATTSGLKKVDWSLTNFAVYENQDSQPRIFATEKLFAVVGPELLGPKLPAAVYFEDGRLDPRDLEGKAAESAVLVFNGKDKTDLALSFLQKDFIPPFQSSSSQWAVFGPSDYLKYKFELLTRGVKYRDFDYGQGIAFSSQAGEKIEYEFEASQSGQFVLAVRSLAGPEGSLGLSFAGIEKTLVSPRKDLFAWQIVEANLQKGKHKLVLENKSGLEVVNLVVLIPKEQYEAALAKADVFTKHFRVVGPDEVGSLVAQDLWQKVDYEKVSPVRYRFTPPAKGYWLIFSDAYYPQWKLKLGVEYFDSVPVFSTINGFYVDPEWKDTEIIFKGQEQARWGIYYTIVNFFVLAVIFFSIDRKF